jgi:ABC-type bacteriocin/lantibiotic exporter with double-glycine peptidase domain
MVNLFRQINKKINGVIWSLVSTGVILIFLAILIVWTDFMLRLVFGLLVLVIAWVFLYGGYKIWSLKKEIEKHFKL